MRFQLVSHTATITASVEGVVCQGSGGEDIVEEEEETVAASSQKILGDSYEYNVTDETRLIDNILSGYNPASRPVYNASHTVTVKFGITLTQISDMDEVNQVLTMNVWLEQEWEDERLTWDPQDYNNLYILRLPCELLWLPDIVLYNSADDFTTGYMKSKAMVYSNGTVFWAPPARFRSSCKIDITYFPFDDQSCELKFGSWTYDGFQVDVTNRTSRVDLQNYVYSGEWELIDVRIRRTVVKYACCVETYPDVRFTVVIRRKTLYYLFNIIFPCLWLTILSLLGFWLPPESGEKITLGITVLLAFSVFMLLIAESMPATSEFVPLMGIYLTITMGMTSMSIILTVFVLQLHHVGPHKRPVPGWLNTLVVGVFSRLVCIPGEHDACYSPLISHSQCTLLCPSSSQTAHSSATRPRNCDQGQQDMSADSFHFSQGQGTTLQNSPKPRLSFMQAGMMCQSGCMEGPALEHYQQLVLEWQFVAHVMDRLLFWLFLALAIVCSLAILVIKPLFKPEL
ncbi:hypothetical protein EGW08_017150 [Elysia chlorotica]|uniref:Neurotransmitter-gated ion-channel ligand-binding domain-containing protein n=1 Tax=Elysia chlorotica TaxID=188477 RepID=A0A433T0L8_ELYCH|nr:hypothetical protein EGW08_017150 [Elysia chlorotica]